MQKDTNNKDIIADHLKNLFRDNYYTISRQGSSISKKVKIFSIHFGSAESDNDDHNQHFKIHIKKYNLSELKFYCKLENRKLPENYITRDNRGKSKGTFGYNNSGGELIVLKIPKEYEQSLINGNSEMFEAYIEVENHEEGETVYLFDDEEEGLVWNADAEADVPNLWTFMMVV